MNIVIIGICAIGMLIFPIITYIIGYLDGKKRGYIRGVIDERDNWTQATVMSTKTVRITAERDKQ